MLISICIGLTGDTTYNRRVRYFIWLGLGQALGPTPPLTPQMVLPPAPMRKLLRVCQR